MPPPAPVVVPFDTKLRITAATDLSKPEVKKIAVAEPSSVPVGVYTKAYFVVGAPILISSPTLA